LKRRGEEGNGRREVEDAWAGNRTSRGGSISGRGTVVEPRDGGSFKELSYEAFRWKTAEEEGGRGDRESTSNHVKVRLDEYWGKEKRKGKGNDFEEG